eukprot:1160217-Pelagomonas_calceolata.AAC.9
MSAHASLYMQYSFACTLSGAARQCHRAPPSNAAGRPAACLDPHEGGPWAEGAASHPGTSDRLRSESDMVVRKRMTNCMKQAHSVPPKSQKGPYFEPR